MIVARRRIERRVFWTLVATVGGTYLVLAFALILVTVGAPPEWPSAILVALPSLVLGALALSIDRLTGWLRPLLYVTVTSVLLVVLWWYVVLFTPVQSFWIAFPVGAGSLVFAALLAYLGGKPTLQTEPKSASCGEPAIVVDVALTSEHSPARLYLAHLAVGAAGGLVVAAVMSLVRRESRR